MRALKRSLSLLLCLLFIFSAAACGEKEANQAATATQPIGHTEAEVGQQRREDADDGKHAEVDAHGAGRGGEGGEDG